MTRDEKPRYEPVPNVPVMHSPLDRSAHRLAEKPQVASEAPRADYMYL
jgi:hypothetical protein